MTGQSSTRTRAGWLRARVAAAVVGLAALMASMFAAVPPGWAATVYELDGEWTAETPETVQTGGAVAARWWFNLNDDAPAPGNDPIDSNVLTVTAQGAVFDELPLACEVDGAEPASQISDDGSTLVCNIGTEYQGSAITLGTGARVTAASGEQVSASATINDQTVELPPLNVENDFLQDIHWVANANQRTSDGSNRDFWFNWTIFHGTGSAPGPATVTYELNVTNSLGASTRPVTDACQAFSTGTAAGHPWSGAGHPSEQTAPFVDSCTLTRNSNTSYTLTISGIDYSKAQVPTHDSTGQPLPTDRQAVAAGTIRISLATSAGSGQVSVIANAPEYGSDDDQSVTDDPSNNTSTQAWTSGIHYGGWRNSLNWGDTLRLSRGTDWWVDTSLTLPNVANPGAVAGSCLILDTRYVSFNGQVETVDSLNNWSDLNLPVEYYIGNTGAPRLDPEGDAYDPNLATPCAASTGWVTTPPEAPSTVWAIRTTYDPRPISNARAYLRAGVTVHEDVEVGQDVWMFSAYANPNAGANNGNWVYPNRGGAADTPPAATPTPDARYAFSYAGRDIMRVIGLEPHVAKDVTPAVINAGETATYTLTYSADGLGAVEPFVDGYEIVDTLPEGATYVTGSAPTEPQVSSTNGRQVLTWTFDDVATNTEHTFAYDVDFDADIAGGSVLANEVTTTVDGLSSTVATASVTTNDAGTTQIIKTADQAFIPNLAGDGVGEGSWTVRMISRDPATQEFTDTIDILPYNGDGRGTSFTGTYELSGPIEAPAGTTVYYTTANPAELTDDPADAMHGTAGDVAGNSVGWTTDFTPEATAVRLITGELSAFEAFDFTIPIVTDGAEGGDVLVNRAQGRAENTRLVMRTSAETQIANYYSVNLKKYVQDADGEWRDANDPGDYPVYKLGDTVPYRIVVENTGQGTVTGLVITDDLFDQGSFTVDELAPGDTASHEFETTLEAGADDVVVNTACAEADIPADSGVAPTINCDPAGIVAEGTPIHDKELVSATPAGDGAWDLVYRITVENTDPFATSYWLSDTLHFTDQATITSAAVTAAPDGVTLVDPAWDGQDNTAIAAAVPLAGNDENDYAPHVYEVSVTAEVPLQLEGVDDAIDPSDCPAPGSDADQGFNNVSQLTSGSGDTDTDQACAPIPSIDIAKYVAEGPVANGDGTWTVIYELLATNAGAGGGTYEITDRMSAGSDFAIVAAEVTDAPEGVTPNAEWTGLAPEGGAANVIATDVALPAETAHTYRIEVTLGLDSAADGAPVITGCDDPAANGGGVSNTAGIDHNDLTDAAEACITVGLVVVDKSIADGPTPNGDGTWTIVYDVIAENIGAAATDYDLSDRLRYGEDIDILDAAVVTAPAAVDTNAGWTGLGAADDDVENVIAAAVELDEGETHLYQIGVTVRIAGDDIDPRALECPAPGSGENGGLANSASLDSNGIVSRDEACASLPLIDITKTISDGPAANGDGTWTITYDLLVSNTGQAAGDYELRDQLRYGEGIDISSADVVSAPQGLDVNAGWTGQGAAGAAEIVIVPTGTIEADASHEYTVEVTVALDAETITPGELQCPEPGTGEPGGLANAAGLTHNGETRSDEACASLPLISITKSLSGPVTPVADGDGVYDAAYDITVTNSGAGAGAYDLDDTLAPGDGVTVVGIQGVATDAPDAVLNDGFDGVADVRIVSDQPIAGAAGAAPETHTYTVTVRYAVNLAEVDPADGEACTTGDGTVAGALHNVAAVDWNGATEEDDECLRPGKPTLDKSLVSAAPVGAGHWEVVYELTVGNVGGEATTYDLDDELLFAPVITVEDVDVTGPAGIALNSGFDGAGDQRIATDATIAGLDDENYAPHVYRVTVVAGVPLLITEVGDDGTGSPSCTSAPGGNFTEQGLNNAATLTDETGGTQVDTDCAPVPSIGITKVIDGEPAQGEDGLWQVPYVITVTNDGGAEGTYDVSDRLRYGAGITVRDVEVTGPDGVSIATGWTGQGERGAQENILAAGVTLPAGAMHTYAVLVHSHVDPEATDESTFNCPDPGTGGRAGFANTAGVAHNDLTQDVDACATPPPAETPPPSPDMPSTGVDMTPAAMAVGLLLLGAGVFAARRRLTT